MARYSDWKYSFFSQRFSLALCVNNCIECPLCPVLCDISLFLDIFGTD